MSDLEALRGEIEDAIWVAIDRFDSQRRLTPIITRAVFPVVESFLASTSSLPQDPEDSTTNEDLARNLADAQKTIRAFVSPDADGYDYTAELRFALSAETEKRAAMENRIRALADDMHDDEQSLIGDPPRRRLIHTHESRLRALLEPMP